MKEEEDLVIALFVWGEMKRVNGLRDWMITPDIIHNLLFLRSKLAGQKYRPKN